MFAAAENAIFGYDVGERVPVKYFAHDRVLDATTADFNGMYGWKAVLAGIGSLGVLGGAAYLAFQRRRDAKRPRSRR
jgi:hypothetical protein